MSVFGAVLEQLESRLAVDGIARYLTLPSFALGYAPTDFVLDPEELLRRGAATNPGDAVREAFCREHHLSVLLDELPGLGPEHVVRGAMVSSVVDRLATAHGPPGREDLAQVVAAALEPLLQPKRTCPEHDQAYRPTNTQPPPEAVLREEAWVRIPLDDRALAASGDRLSVPVRAWLERRGLHVDDLGDHWVAQEARIEVLPLVVIRPWWPEALLSSRAWTWLEGPLSDGGEPPQGQLTARIVAVVLARRFEVTVAPAIATPGPRPPGLGLVRRRLHVSAPLDGRDKVLAPTPMGPATMMARTTEHATFPVPVRFVAGDALAQGREELTLAGGRVDEARRGLAEARGAREAREADRARAAPGLRATIERLKKLSRIRVPFGGGISGFTAQLAAAQTALATLDAAVTAAAAEEARRAPEVARLEAELVPVKARLDELTELLEGSPPDGLYVLAFVAERTPRAPDPDLALFT